MLLLLNQPGGSPPASFVLCDRVAVLTALYAKASWPFKDPDEILDYDIDWTQRLYSEAELARFDAGVEVDPADTIASSSFTLPVGSRPSSAQISSLPRICGCKIQKSFPVWKRDYVLVEPGLRNHHSREGNLSRYLPNELLQRRGAPRRECWLSYDVGWKTVCYRIEVVSSFAAV